VDTSWIEKMKVQAEATARTFGLELFDLEYRLSGRRWWFRITLDRLDGPVTIENCEQMSRQLSAQLDVEDLVPHAYELEVSSPGVERPLRRPQDYDRFKGQRARVILGEGGPDAGQAVEGELEGTDEMKVVIRVDGEARRLPLERIKKAHLVFQFPGSAN
jgi:ribosome maturation factor RimP